MINIALSGMFRGRLAYRLVSIISGLFAGVVALLFGTVTVSDSAVRSAEFGALTLFTLLTYGYLQFAVAVFERKPERTWRARAHFWLLALYPLWCIPAFWAIVRILRHVA